MDKISGAIKDWWFIALTVVAFIVTWTTSQNQLTFIDSRLENVEQRMDKKDDQYLSIQTQLAQISADVARLNANTSIILKKLDLK